MRIAYLYYQHLEIKNKYAKLYWKLQKRKGVNQYEAASLLRERNYFACMMVKNNDAVQKARRKIE